MSPHFEYLLRIADNSLILGQRLAETCGHGPIIEEDIALTNIALDLIGQARLLLSHAGRIEGRGRDEDQLAFLRAEHDFRNVTLVELPNGDFGRIVLRNLFVSAWQHDLWTALLASTDRDLAAIAEKSLKEVRYHREHASDWTIRLGDGTAESHGRMQSALEMLWPYTREFFEPDVVDSAVARQGIGPEAGSLEAGWTAHVRGVLDEAMLSVPDATPFLTRGKCGRHSEHLGHLLAPMQHLQRAYPGGTW
ncbi:MAG: phenylacetate-CoA oxygenase subunit PaaC [Betaproteobacteria bacterium]|nr:phenylacetate-CoA oxygenase subunit PaaC [Betaproteobacteria bacterium]